MGGFGGMRVVYIYIFYFLCIMMFDIFTKKKKKNLFAAERLLRPKLANSYRH